MAKIKKWTPIIVEWMDAVTRHNAVDSEAEYDPMVRRSVGFLISKNRKGVTFALQDDRDDDVPGADCEAVTTIPIKMVVKVIPLQPKEDDNGRSNSKSEDRHDGSGSGSGSPD